MFTYGAAAPAGVNHASDARGVANLEILHLGANSGDLANDLVSGHGGENLANKKR